MTALPISAKAETIDRERRRRPEVELFNPFDNLFRPDRSPKPFDDFVARNRAKDAL